MPRTQLPSGGWVEWTETLMSGTRFDVKDAVRFSAQADGDGGQVTTFSGANDDRQRLAMWYHIITGWSFAEKGIPVPSQNAAGKDGSADLIGATLDLDDFNAFAEATQPLLDKLTASPKRATRSPG